MKTYYQQKGYTLVELLTVIVVLIIAGTLIISIFVSSLRGTNKTNSITAVSENGRYALEQMSRSIRNAETFEGVSLDGIDYTTDCSVPAVGVLTPTPTPAQYRSIQFAGPSGEDVVFMCRYTDPNTGKLTIASQSGSESLSFFDTEAVSVSKCYFTCSQSDISETPLVSVNFSLQATLSGTFLFDNKASASPVPFSTSIFIRNRGR